MREHIRRELGCTYTELDAQPAGDIIPLTLMVADRLDQEAMRAAERRLQDKDAQLRQRYDAFGLR